MTFFTDFLHFLDRSCKALRKHALQLSGTRGESCLHAIQVNGLAGWRAQCYHHSKVWYTPR
jgi:hypothetical protein